ncbi:hypothetical protein H5410_031707 [Solanum commersonii]|uniref:Uncharacterized protein n=1 Tax=Solanum commersonii TaxID=4109 RepID=A0A9J5YJ30_SOLCO|nr:hypothetical protein H5410_031707 [Solanum commersonii]
MAHRKKFSLFVSVLANIYRGLKEISTSPNLSVANIIFPIYYVNSWLREYSGTHYRANHSHQSIPLCNISGKDLHLTDNRKLLNSGNEFIISLRSGYITVRHDSNFIVESYNLKKFS